MPQYSKKDPVDCIEWRHVSELKANYWNPNVVFTRELRLLELSILQTGWVQPLLITAAGMVIDGFHRWQLAQESKELQRIYGGTVPCVVLNIAEPAAMCMTVRINRAKGTHVAVRMADIVQALIDKHGMSREEVGRQIGAVPEEVDVLYQNSIFKTRNLAEYRYSKAWIPKEVP
jgi:ParB-like chromosome segregation protein Spo0J